MSKWLDRIKPDRARLEVGELALAPGVPFALDAGGFGRHTFLCGQSGSGKTYALGVLLEHLMMETGVRVVVLDPNSDHVHLSEPARRRAATSSRRATGKPRARLGCAQGRRARAAVRVRFRELSSAWQAAALRLDPLADREEYSQLLALVEDEDLRSVEDLARF